MDLKDSLLSKDLISYITSKVIPELLALLTLGEKSITDIKNISFTRIKL